MYEYLTYEMILQRMLDRVPNSFDKREGSVIWDALAPAAVELKLMYIEFDNIMNNSFADTATRDYLIRRAAERGIVPYPATKSTLQGVFTPATIDITGKRFRMPNTDITYIVNDMISPGVYQVECETPGTEGNQYLGTIIPIDYIQGLQTAELTDILIPAVNEEETEHLRQRYFDSFSEKAFGGNRKDYLYKTNSIEGVGATKVTPIWNGGGTVKLTILDAQYNPASSVLVDKVQQKIDPTRDGMGFGLAPIGHVVTVDSATEVSIAITAAVVLAEGVSWASVQLQAITAIQSYFSELRTTWANENNLIVRVSQIDTRLLAVQGVIDIQDTRLNGSASNITLGEYEIPIFGGITV